MKAMILPETVSLEETDTPLRLVEKSMPVPAPNEVLIQVLTCGVCHTELDEIEGRLTPPELPVVLGHQVVGRVVETGADVFRHCEGDRVGVGWIHSSTGEEDENLSEHFHATGCHVNGGYAEFMTVGEDYAYPIPEVFNDEEAAPLLCAGAIGYRALQFCEIEDGDSLGLMGFGGSAHIVIQLAQHLYPQTRIYVFARNAATREFAEQLGACWSGDIGDRAPETLKAVIDTTPAWKPVVKSLANLGPGGRLVINAIRKEEKDKEALLELSYQEHLWMERKIRSVANITSHDISEFLPIAGEIPIKTISTVYPLDQANQALMDLKRGRIRGAAVLRVSDFPDEE